MRSHPNDQSGKRRIGHQPNNRYNHYNYREYILRRVKEEFRENKTVQDPQDVEKLLQKAQHNLDIVKRQGVISRLYPHQHLVLEK